MELAKKVAVYAKQHPKKFILLSAMFILVSILVFTYVRDSISQRRVGDSMDRIRVELSRAGFSDVKDDSGCWRLDTKLGPGAKICDTGFKLIVPIVVEVKTGVTRFDLEKSEQEADKIMTVAAGVINGAQDFQASGPRGSFPSRVKSDDSPIRHGAYSYRHKDTGYGCIASYDYRGEEQSLVIRFYCDSSSWFVRNVDRGWFGD